MLNDEFLTFLPIRCQRRSGYARAVVPRFVEANQVYSGQAVCLAPVEPTRPVATPQIRAHSSSQSLEHGL
jgi:hypothetical protein